MLGNLRSALARLRRSRRQPRRKLTAVLTSQCLEELTIALRDSSERGHEGIVYLVGLTTGTATLAVTAMGPQADTTPVSVDVAAINVGTIVREAALAGLQVVGAASYPPRRGLSQCWRPCRDAHPAPRLHLNRGSRVRRWTAITGGNPHADVD